MPRRDRKPGSSRPQKKPPQEAEPAAGGDREPMAALASAEEAAWQHALHQLQQYHREHGHCHVPAHEKRHRKLAAWVALQREIEQRGALRPERRSALEALGMGWEVEEGKSRSQLYQDARWNQRYTELVAFQKEHGHTRVSARASGNKVLADWRHVQREFRRHGKLSAERIARLDAIGFEWEEPGAEGQSFVERLESKWERRFQQLVEYQRAQGHCYINKADKENPELGEWVGEQRRAFGRGRLRPDRVERLNALGFLWRSGFHTWKEYRADEVRAAREKTAEKLVALWEQRYAEMVAFQQEHGHTRVTERPPGNKVLAHWRHVQREFRRKGMLKAERIARLDAIGFEWEEPDRQGRTRDERWENQWERMFQKLVAHHAAHGHCHVLTENKEDPHFGSWVSDQRKAFKKGKLRADRVERLNALGFIWRSNFQTWKKYRGDEVWAARQKTAEKLAPLWEQRYAEMVAFQKEHGHTRVPKRPPGNKVLWHWRMVQREFRRKARLSAERIARLDAIGFEWAEPPGPSRPVADYWEPRWNAMFERLREFRERFGHTRVPKRWEGDRSLGTWVLKQREAIRQETMTAERRARLESLGFEAGKSAARLPRHSPKPRQPGAHKQGGLARLEALRQFRERFGHTRVPRYWKEDPSLGEWVRAQRRAGRRDQLSPERRAALDRLGFEWSTRNGK